MSFSSEVKEELVRQNGSAKHCQIAEIAAMICFAGSIRIRQDDRLRVGVVTENFLLARRFAILLYRSFRIPYEVRIRAGHGNTSSLYVVMITDPDMAYELLYATGFIDEDGQFNEELDPDRNPVLKKECCRRAFLRGAFLATGSMSDPKNSYHLDIGCGSEERAEQVRMIMESLGISSRVTFRKNQSIVYIKDGEMIVDLLGNMGAPNALMAMENERIMKEMRNNVNRKVNCETANIHKTVSAAMKQIEDIRFLDEVIGIRKLPPVLAEMARVRLEFPNATLTELGEQMDPPVGKSGINHRLRKLSELAAKHRLQ